MWEASSLNTVITQGKKKGLDSKYRKIQQEPLFLSAHPGRTTVSARVETSLQNGGTLLLQEEPSSSRSSVLPGTAFLSHRSTKKPCTAYFPAKWAPAQFQSTTQLLLSVSTLRNLCVYTRYLPFFLQALPKPSPDDSEMEQAQFPYILRMQKNCPTLSNTSETEATNLIGIDQNRALRVFSRKQPGLLSLVLGL